MKIEEFSKLIKEYNKGFDVELNEEKIEKFYKYMELLIEWNEKMNLTAITEPNDIILKHFIDSITIEKYIEKNANLIDVGTGAGFPGIPLKIVRDDLQITLMDSLNKRIKFLDEVIKVDDLKNIDAIHSRAEELSRNKDFRESFDYATSRAVASLNVLLEYMLPFVKVGGYCICMKGANVDEEIETSKKALNILNAKIEKVDSLCLPMSDYSRNIVIVKKVGKTPEKYPRKPGQPAKEPLC